MRIILKSLEDMDRKRLSCFKDALRKFMVYQISALRNLQYDADLTVRVNYIKPENVFFLLHKSNCVFQSIESLDEHSEIQEFIRRAKADLASRLQKASSNVPDTLQLQPVQDPNCNSSSVLEFSIPCLASQMLRNIGLSFVWSLECPRTCIR